MNPNVILILVAGGVALFVLMRGRASAGGILPSSPIWPAPTAPPYDWQSQNVSGYYPITTGPGNMPMVQGRPSGPGAVIAGTTASIAPIVASTLGGGAGATATGAAAGTTAATVGGGSILGMSTAVAIPVIGGLAALATWGIVQKGFLRGGWEGIKGNTIRDKFLQQFVDVYFPGSGSERQYDAISSAYQEADRRARAIGLGGSLDGDVANRHITALYSADSEDEMRAAMRAIVQDFALIGVPVQSPL